MGDFWPVPMMPNVRRSGGAPMARGEVEGLPPWTPTRGRQGCVQVLGGSLEEVTQRPIAGGAAARGLVRRSVTGGDAKRMLILCTI